MTYNYADLQKYSDQLLQISSLLKPQMDVVELQTASSLLRVIANDLRIVSHRLQKGDQTI